MKSKHGLGVNGTIIRKEHEHELNLKHRRL